MKGDVYPVEPSDGFLFNKVLDAHWGVLYDEDVRKLIAASDPFAFVSLSLWHHCSQGSACRMTTFNKHNSYFNEGFSIQSD